MKYETDVRTEIAVFVLKRVEERGGGQLKRARISSLVEGVCSVSAAVPGSHLPICENKEGG